MLAFYLLVDVGTTYYLLAHPALAIIEALPSGLVLAWLAVTHLEV